jgi:DNA repair protein RadC
MARSARTLEKYMLVGPREKLVSHGVHNLSDAELLALLLNTGRKGKHVLSLAKLLVKQLPFSHFAAVTLDDLIAIAGVGQGKASRIIAAVELGKRLFATPALETVIIRSTEDALKQVTDIAAARQEIMVVLYINARSELIQKERIAIGAVNAARILPKEVFAPAMLTPCTGIIIAHNHPSGDPTPSEDDIVFTKRLTEAAEVMGITLLDHLIVASHAYFSFEKGEIC